MDELLKWRGEFPILDRTTYMISNSLGAMPRGVYDEMRVYADSWAERGVRAWEEGWWEMAVGVGDRIAPLIGAGPGEISLHQNVTLTQAVISSCFDLRGPRNKIVMVELEFPSIQYFYHEQRRHGARVEVVSTPDQIRIDTERCGVWCGAIGISVKRSRWVVMPRIRMRRTQLGPKETSRGKSLSKIPCS